MLEAFPDYWRKPPSVKRLVMKSIPEESTRAAAVKTGEVDIAYLFGGELAQELRRTPGVKIVAPLVYGVYWLDFLDQWEPKSRGTIAGCASRPASPSTARPSIRRRCSASGGRPVPSSLRRSTSPCPSNRPPTIPSAPKQLLTEAGYPNGFEEATSTPLPPYATLGEAVASYLQAVGIKTRVRTMERAAFLASWREKKLKGLLIGATGAAGNAAARLDPFVTKDGLYAYGTLPEMEDLFKRQAKELDRKQREALLHQIQRSVADHVLVAPLFQQAFIWGWASAPPSPEPG